LGGLRLLARHSLLEPKSALRIVFVVIMILIAAEMGWRAATGI
jgi:hypothetical protein